MSTINGRKNSSTWNICHLNGDLNQELLNHFKGERSAFIQVGPKKYFLPERFAEDGDKYYLFKPRPSDVWIVTFPRSGTTWTQEMVWLLGNNLDYKKAASIPLIDRFPFLEFSSCVNKDLYNEILEKADTIEMKNNFRKTCDPVLERLEETTERRFIKSHLPLSLLPPDLLTCGAKVIYVARNPKDVAVSYFNFHQFMKTLDFIGDFETFWNYFEQNLQLWAPYWSHIIEAWESRRNPNLLFLFYEDLKKDLHSGMKNVASFLQTNYTEAEFNKLADHLDFGNFQKNQSVNMDMYREVGLVIENGQKAVRQGKIGNWKEVFTEKLNDQANRWIQKNLESTDLRFPEAF